LLTQTDRFEVANRLAVGDWGGSLPVRFAVWRGGDAACGASAAVDERDDSWPECAHTGGLGRCGAD